MSEVVTVPPYAWMPTTTFVWDLPEDHLFRLVYRVYLDHTPVDWNAVLRRLATHPWEAQQWIKTDYLDYRLFLHELCDYDFGWNGRDNNHRRIPTSNSLDLRALKEAIDAYPEAVLIPDTEGYYPLHIICRRAKHRGPLGSAPSSWNESTLAAFKLIFYAYPAAASLHVQSESRTALHCLLNAYDNGEGPGKEEALQVLLDEYPEALRLPDTDGRYPLHVARQSRPSIVKILLKRFPRAAEIRCTSSRWGCRTPLLEALRCARYPAAKMLLETCPWAAGVEDEADGVLTIDDVESLDPVGDALDYIYVRYTEIVGVNWMAIENADNIFDNDDDYVVDYRNYIEANINFLARTTRPRREDAYGHIESAFDMVLAILRTMYGKSPFLPVHAAVQGRLCRPWNLVALKKLLQHFAHEAHEEDADGNLPLHLFLESCMIEQDRAVERGYAKNAEAYQDAVARCLRMILDANPRAARQTNGGGRLPLYLAIENASFSYDAMIAPLLELHPEALLARDTKTTLHPFVLAAVGTSSNLDLVFTLLRRDPTVVMQFMA